MKPYSYSFFLTGFFVLIGCFVQLAIDWQNFPAYLFQAFVIGLLVALLQSLFIRSVPFSRLLFRSIRVTLTVFGVILSIVVAFAVYHNSFPGKVGKIILSNGEREIVFYQMSHIASADFYGTIHSDLLELTENGSMVYIEGVRPGTAENMQEFHEYIGIDFEKDPYVLFARMVGLSVQDESLFQGIPPDTLVPTDVSVDDIVAMIGTGGVQKLGNTESLDFSEIGLPEVLSPFGQYMIRGLLNGFLKVDMSLLLDTTSMKGGIDPRVFEVILDARNEYVIHQYLENPPQKAVFLYGALHFQGMYELLKQSDPNWKIVSSEPMAPYVLHAK